MTANGNVGRPAPSPTVVFDTVVLLQALIAPGGPAARCLAAAEAGRLTLCVSDPLLAEAQGVTFRPKFAARFRLTPERVDAFLAGVRDHAVLVAPVPHVFDLARDPKDEMVVDLAAAAGANPIVSRDRDLLDLSDPATADREDAVRFRRQFPALRVVDPVRFLQELDER